MFVSIEDFIKTWEDESASTLKLFGMIDERRFHEQLAPNVRSCARLAFHITETIGEMMEKTGLHIDGYEEGNDIFWTKAELISTYQSYSDSLIRKLRMEWKDEDLHKKDMMYGEEWRRGTTLDVLMRHQTHHRGEMIVVMRLLGMKVFGIYGPAQEEWAAMGMQPML
jgi:uncharacterized damage-inducible protein DinB